MKLTLVAATGATGRLVLEQASAAGHEVTAVVRSPGKLPSGVGAVRADLSRPDPGVLASAVAGADAVVSALGATSKAEAGVAATGTRALIAAMRAAGTRRLVVLSAAPIGTVPTAARPDKPRHDPGDGFLLRRLTPIVKRALAAHYADLAAMEDAVVDSGLDWTIVRPPQLTDKPAAGRWRTQVGHNPRNGFTIARADLAAAMLAAVSDPAAVRRVLGVAY
ncbi:NAD(P)-dependent oxidoreductase [Glycomyces harbinensis]|uniref:Putative NADH-flavin reductase n=1 Tax=Glycomyces harbinensis TaxID=58114 RepID=A0A1G6RBT6_9ACTN|nr:NAD(P)H-binding protein [Glycomyces harbinensis]SDD02090.1 Putative NADH-flavin reductase [Glycomyces harbinensis]